MSLRNVRDFLFLIHGMNIVHDEEFLLLFDANRSSNPDFAYWNYRRLT